MTTYTIPGSINATGAVDVTQDIIDWIDSTVVDGTVGAPNTVQFGIAATYRCDLTILIQDRNWLNFDGRGSTFQTDVIGPAANRYHWSMERCSNIDLDDIIIRGPNANGGIADAAYIAAWEFEHGFAFWSCVDIRLHHCNATKMYGDYVYLGLRGAGVCDGIEIDNNYFGANGRQGIAFVGAHNTEVHHNTTGECRRSMMDFEPNGVTNTCDNVWVHHNAFGRQRLSFCASKGAPGAVNNITIEDNTCFNLLTTVQPTGYGLRENWIIRNNVASTEYGTPSGKMMAFYKTVNVNVTGNTAPLQSGRNMYLARFSDCTGIVCSGNDISPGGVGQYFEDNAPAPVPDPESSTPQTPPNVATGSTVEVATSGAYVLDIPSGAVVGDEVLAWIGHQGTSFTDLIPADWTLLSSQVLSHNDIPLAYVVLAQHTLTAADMTAGGFTFTFHEASISARSAGVMVALQGLFSRTPDFLQEIVDLDANSSEIDLPGAETTAPGCLVLFFAAQRTGNGVLTYPAGITGIATSRNQSTAGLSLAVASVVYTGFGLGQARTFASTILAEDCGVTVAFQGTVLEVLRKRVHMVNALNGAAGGVRLALSDASKLALAP